MTPMAEWATNPFYLHLYQLAREEPLAHVLEVGSADGSGSTRMIVDAILARRDGLRPQLYCLEPDPQAYTALQARYADLPWVHCFPWFSLSQSQLPSEADIAAFYARPGNALRRYSLNEVLGWLAREREAEAGRSERTPGIETIKARFGIERFDLVVLDGAEFSGDQDLEPVYGARLIVLDDANSYKNTAVRERLSRDPDYTLLQVNLQWQHGMAIFKRRPPRQPGLSVVVHTRNAAELLPDALASVAWADETIVVDMDSSDETLAVAQAHGARIAHHIQVDCVDEARNWALSLAAYDWTLVLDADERITPTLQARIQAAIAPGQGKPDGYWLPRWNFFFGQPAPNLFPDFQLRLFRSQGAYWGGVVHELPQLLGKEGYFPAEVEGAIQHYSYRDVGDFVQRQMRYADTLWRQLGRFPTQTLSPMAHELRARFESQQERALEYLREHAVDSHDWLVRQLYLFSDLAMCAVMLERSGQLVSAQAGDKVRLSVYSYVKNALSFDYPFRESLRSVLPVCDEAVVFYAIDSEDDTLGELQALAAEFPQLRLYPSTLWQTKREGGETIRLAAEEAMAACSGDWLWHVQADEVYSDADARRVRELVEMYQGQNVQGIRFQVLHFYGNYDTLISPQAAEIGWYQHTIRLSRKGWGRHYGDAWTLSFSGEGPANVVGTDIMIYHYGHVREAEAMRVKSSYMERLYHDLPEDFSVCAPGSFSYDKVPLRYLKAYDRVHPEAMLARIAAARLHAGLRAWARAPREGRAKPRLLVISRHHKIKKGFGITLNELYATGLLQAHFEVGQLAWHYEGEPGLQDGVMVWPAPEKSRRQDLRQCLYEFAPDVILLHADAHFFLPHLKELTAWQGAVVGWFTVDYERRRNPSQLVPLLARCQRVLSMGEASLIQLRRDYKGVLAKVPLGVNPGHFYPVPLSEKQRLRRELGLPEQVFVFLMVANNFWRKGIEYALLSFAQFLAKYRDVAKRCLLYLHTESSEVLHELIKAYDLQQHVRISLDFDPYRSPLPESQLAQLYQCADAFFLPSLGEGFGMPVLEAQACGLPLIISDNSVLREVGGDAALYIRCPGYVGGQNADAFVWMRSPDPDHAAELMYRLRTSSGLRERLSAAGLRQASQAGWGRTALLLAAELAAACNEGTLVYQPPEPGLRPV